MEVKIKPLGMKQVEASRSADGLYYYTQYGTFLKAEVEEVVKAPTVPEQPPEAKAKASPRGKAKGKTEDKEKASGKAD